MAGTTEAIERLAADLGDLVYLDIAKWHLYLNNAHLHQPLAEKLYPLLRQGKCDPASVRQVLQEIVVPVGGGKRSLTLLELIPDNAIHQLIDRLDDLARDL